MLLVLLNCFFFFLNNLFVLSLSFIFFFSFFTVDYNYFFILFGFRLRFALIFNATLGYYKRVFFYTLFFPPFFLDVFKELILFLDILHFCSVSSD